ncbi:hypothetical protein CDAR_373471 [Caerostris darwini]|uniref:Transmembrane protein n=1 Tax=Caerostris darwini TaxID=1538125 RepID=A0AAV4QN29_9ARAC|nr:hypothetical protein CDAR_373471 [Caerostris darwini]
MQAHCWPRDRTRIREGNSLLPVRRTAFPPAVPLVLIEDFPPACMFSGRKASERISTSPGIVVHLPRGYWRCSAEWKIEKEEKEKKAVLEHMRVRLCMFLFSAAAATHTFFHFLCDAGSEIGAVLPKAAAPKAGSLAHRFPLALKSPIIFNGYRFTRTLCYLILLH